MRLGEYKRHLEEDPELGVFIEECKELLDKHGLVTDDALFALALTEVNIKIGIARRLPGKCPRCGKPKPREAFLPNESKLDGLSTYCRSCTNEYNKEYIKTKVEPKAERKCGKCGETKGLAEFYKNAAYRDGFDNYCKKCKDKYNKVQRQKRAKSLDE